MQIHLKTLICVLASKNTGLNGFLWGQVAHYGGPLSSLLFQIFLDDLLKDIQNSNNGINVYDTEIASSSFADDMSHIFK